MSKTGEGRKDKPPVYYARVYSWMRARGIKMGVDQWRYLKDYEATNGRVPARTLSEWRGNPF